MKLYSSILEMIYNFLDYTGTLQRQSGRSENKEQIVLRKIIGLSQI